MDGAPPNFGENVRTYPINNFANQWIRRGGPPKSPLNYYLREHIRI